MSGLQAWPASNEAPRPVTQRGALIVLALGIARAPTVIDRQQHSVGARASASSPEGSVNRRAGTDLKEP
jgi:hypothetical protein